MLSSDNNNRRVELPTKADKRLQMPTKPTDPGEGTASPSAFGVYVHWPFCESKCPYCDFNSHVSEAVDHTAWAEAYRREIARVGAAAPGRTVTSVFFGGGTPTLMKAATVEMILSEIARVWTLAPDVEITAEANPSSAEIELFRDLA